jgi:bifunctional oligoribonuclease and PAP phosphatase NrnA
MEKNNPSLLEEIRQRLQDAERILIVSHIRPDGDAVGSLLGLGLALESVGKQVQMVLADGVPTVFHHLPGVQKVKKAPEGEVDLFITLDCSDLERVGEITKNYGPPNINIDHHVTNLNFAEFNLIDAEAVATAEMLAIHLQDFDLPLNLEVADALLTGIITDTIGFRTSNMTPRALRVAASLMEVGSDLPGLYAKALLRRSYEAARLWGVGLSKLNREGSIVWTSINTGDRRSVGYTGRDDADLINIIASVEGARIAILFNEQSSSSVKISWRAQPGYDVAKVALNFGGGGHTAAAGAEMVGALHEVQEKVLNRTKLLLSEAIK